MRFGFGFAMMAAILGGGASVGHAATIPTNQTASKKDAIRQDIKQVRPESTRRKDGSFSDANPYKYNKPGFLDQKSKRRKLRSNAHFARSKKCTTKR